MERLRKALNKIGFYISVCIGVPLGIVMAIPYLLVFVFQKPIPIRKEHMPLLEEKSDDR